MLTLQDTAAGSAFSDDQRTQVEELCPSQCQRLTYTQY
jgi:hypothetical protein